MCNYEMHELYHVFDVIMHPLDYLFYLLFTFRWRLNPYKLSTHKGQCRTPVLGNKNVFSILNRAHANSIAN